VLARGGDVGVEVVEEGEWASSEQIRVAGFAGGQAASTINNAKSVVVTAIQTAVGAILHRLPHAHPPDHTKPHQGP
jgi:hypothetical protein